MRKEKTNVATKDTYTSTEVGAMFESLGKEIRIVAEGHSDLNRHMEKIEVAVQGNSSRLDTIDIRTCAVEFKINQVEFKITQLREEVKKEIGDFRAEVRNDFHALGDRLTAAESRNG